MSLVDFKTNTQIAADLAAELKGKPETAPIAGLVNHLMTKWEAAKNAKTNIEQMMLKAMRQRQGIYDASKLAAIRQVGSSEVYMMLTDTKCRTCEAWLKDILFSTGVTPWDIAPTPVPQLPAALEQELQADITQQVMALAMQEAAVNGTPMDPTAMQSLAIKLKDVARKMMEGEVKTQARRKAERMKDEINDQLIEGGWYKALENFISDVVTLKNGFVRGPIPMMTTTKERARKDDGSWTILYNEEIIPTYCRRSPFDIYPAPDSNDIDDGYLFDRIMISPVDLAAMDGLPGWNSDEIRAVLEEHREGKLRSWTVIDSERAVLEGKKSEAIWQTDKVECLNYWGTIPGVLLKEWGVKGIDQVWREYHASVYMVGRHVIKAAINKDPRGKKPYSKTCFKETPGAFWGHGVPEIIEDLQTVCNAIARAIVNNVGIASGPQVEMNEDRFPADDGGLYPWKVWRATNDQMVTSPALRFYVTPLIADKLITIYQHFSKLADEQSGIPAYAHGDTQVGGAGNTSSGLSMLMNAASRQIKDVIKGIDRVMVESIERQYDYNILFGDPDLIGDLRIVARGSSSMIVKEQQAVRRTEFVQATNNPVDNAIIGPKGRKYLLTEVARSLDIDVEKIFGDEDMEALLQPLMPQPMVGPEGNVPGEGEVVPQGTGPVPPRQGETLDMAGGAVAGQGARLFQNDTGR